MPSHACEGFAQWGYTNAERPRSDYMRTRWAIRGGSVYTLCVRAMSTGALWHHARWVKLKNISYEIEASRWSRSKKRTQAKILTLLYYSSIMYVLWVWRQIQDNLRRKDDMSSSYRKSPTSPIIKTHVWRQRVSRNWSDSPRPEFLGVFLWRQQVPPLRLS